METLEAVADARPTVRFAGPDGPYGNHYAAWVEYARSRYRARPGAKVPAKARATYDELHRRMLDGAIQSWAILDTSGPMLWQVVETSGRVLRMTFAETQSYAGTEPAGRKTTKAELVAFLSSVVDDLPAYRADAARALLANA